MSITVEKILERFGATPQAKKIKADMEAEAVSERQQRATDYAKARVAESADEELAGWRQERTRLLDETKTILHRGNGLSLAFLSPVLADSLHRLNNQIHRRAQSYRSEVVRLRSRLLETVPPDVEARIGSALERIEEMAAEARKASFEKSINKEFVSNGMDEIFLKSADTFMPSVNRLLQEAPKAANELSELRLSVLTDTELDSRIHAILKSLPQLCRVRVILDGAGQLIKS